MENDALVFSVFLVFCGAALLASVALYARQSLLVAYMVVGVIAGPFGAGWVSDPFTVEAIGHLGIVFLLFLLGLNLPAAKLAQVLREALRVTLASSTAFMAAGFALARFGFGLDLQDALFVGAAAMFSSTIIGLKLMPTTTLHHRHMGEIVISILLIQDVLAIALLVTIDALSHGEAGPHGALLTIVALPAVAALAWLLQRLVIIPLLMRFDTIHEYVFLLAVGWCLGIAQLAHSLGLSHETGAFIAGVALATSPISLFIADSLRPLRDFFLVMFFFSLGASFDVPMFADIWWQALLLGVLMLALKPVVLGALLAREREASRFSREVGVRLGQMSEFSLLVMLLALEAALVSGEAFHIVQAATLLTFIVSAYWTMLRYPTPSSPDARLRRD